MITVRQLLQEKGREIFSVRPETTVFEAIQLMAEKGIGALLVMDGTLLAGIFSERDYTRKVALKDRSSRSTSVSEIMTSNVITVRPEQTIDECMVLMSNNRIRHLPVLDGDRVAGVVSIKDALKTVITEKEYIIQQLENYITGTG